MMTNKLNVNGARFSGTVNAEEGTRTFAVIPFKAILAAMPKDGPRHDPEDIAVSLTGWEKVSSVRLRRGKNGKKFFLVER